MTQKILHVLSQRPSKTGSGVTLDAIARHAQNAGWNQAAIVGVPVSDTQPSVGSLEHASIFPITFSDPAKPDLVSDLPFPVPGMSDVMPYPSTVWSQMTAPQLNQYRKVWRAHLEMVIRKFQPDLIHTNHLWLVSSLLPALAPSIPLVATCHATGLRQMELTPALKNEVVNGCAHIDHFFALRKDHKEHLVQVLGLAPQRVSVVGVGYRDEVFFREAVQTKEPGSALYVGKFSESKGLPWLLDAWERWCHQNPGSVLHIAGDGAGQEAEELRARMQAMSPTVVMHGQLDQEQLAHLMNRCQVCILPSLYEGVPLVLAEAAACGCWIVATELPGVMEQLAPHLGSHFVGIPTPIMQGIDRPLPSALPTFVESIYGSLKSCFHMCANLDKNKQPPGELTTLTWTAVFRRIERKWKLLIDSY